MPGEIAEMMLDGTLCSCCGEYLGEDGGYPMMCAGCRRESRERERGNSRQETPEQVAARKPYQCPSCKKRFRKAIGLDDHIRTMHKEKPNVVA